MSRGKYKRYDEETEEYSEDVAILTGEIANLTKVASNNYAGVSLFEPGDPDTYRSTYDIMKDIAEIWDELTDKNRAQLTEALFGKRQAQIGTAILTNFGQAEAAIETMANSAGNANEEMEVIYDSIEYKMNALKETWVGVAQNLIEDDSLKTLVDLLTGLSSVTDGVTGSLGLLGTVSLGMLIAQFVKMISVSGQVKAAVQPALISLANVSYDGTAQSVALYSRQLAALSPLEQQVAMNALGLSTAQKEEIASVAALVGSLNGLTAAEAERMLGLEAGRLSTALDISANEQLTASLIETAIANGTLSKSELEAAANARMQAAASVQSETAVKSFGATAKATASALLTSPMGWIMILTSVVTVISSITKHTYEMRQESIEAAKEIEQAYADAGESASDNIESIEAMREEYEALAQGVSVNGENMSLTSTEYSRFLEISKKLIDISPDIVQSYDASGKAVLNYKDAIDSAIESQNEFLENERAKYVGKGEEIYGGLVAGYEDALGDLGTKGSAVNAAILGDEALLGDIDAMKNALATMGITIDSWYADTDELVQLYERMDEFLLLLRQSGRFTEDRLAGIRVAIQNLSPEIDTLEEKSESWGDWLNAFLTDEDWYSLIPPEAKGAFQEGLNDLFDPEQSVEEARASGRKFGQEFANALNSSAVDNIENLATKLGEGRLSLEDYNAAVEDFKSSWTGSEEVLGALTTYFDSLGNAAEQSADSLKHYSKTLGELKDVVSEAQSAYSLLSDAQEEMNERGGLSPETVAKLAEAEENYIDYLYEENGALKLNTEAWRKNAASKMGNELSEIRKELDSLRQERGELEKELDEKQSISAWRLDTKQGQEAVADLKSGIAELDEAIAEDQRLLEVYEILYSNLADEAGWFGDSVASANAVISSMDNMTDKLSTLAEIQNLVADGFVVSLEKAREFAEVYPELLEKAKVSADGQIQLNADVVNGFVTGKKTELDTAIETQIETLKAELQAKQSSLEVAKAMYTNMKSVRTDLSDTTKQAQEVAKAVGGISEAEVRGNAKILLGSGTRSGMSRAKMELLNDPNMYYLNDGAAESPIKESVEELESDVSEIESAITLLESLKNRPLSYYLPDSDSKTSSSQKEVEEYTVDVERFAEALERLRQTQLRQSELERKLDETDDTKLQILYQKELTEAYHTQQDALHALNDERDAVIANGVNQLRALNFDVEYDPDTNELLIKNLDHINELQGKTQEETNELRKQTEALIEDITDLNEENQQGSEDWWELAESTREASEAITELLNEIIENASNAVDEMQSVYDTLHSAADEYAKTGYVSVDTLQSIIDLGPQYLSYLTDESGALVINEQRIRDVIAAKTEQLGVETALSYVESLRIAKSKGNVEELERLLSATTDATRATWELVYANLEIAGLSETETAAARRNIDALRALTESAIAGTHDTAADALEQLEDMQTGINDLIKYVMDMIKQEIEDQVGLLEDEKEAYSAIIDRQRESLDNAREEKDYRKGLADTLKEMAQLQAKIDALSMDNSREAAAERAKLQEELAEKQADLDDQQAEYAYDAQMDTFDKMEEAYNDEKDAEIDKLRDTVSSYQKLYDLAITRITDAWRGKWDELLVDLKAWNYEYGSDLQSAIEDAWKNGWGAIEQYGGVEQAISGLDRDIERASSSSSSSGQNTQVGNTFYDSGSTRESRIVSLVARMYENSQLWFDADETGRKRLEQDSEDIARQLKNLYGINATKVKGAWYEGTELLFKKYLHYHSGGIVGGGDLKSREQLAVLLDDEWVLSREMVDNLKRQIESIDALRTVALEGMRVSGPGIGGINGAGEAKTISNIVNNNTRPVNITIGDTNITGASDTVTAHMNVNRNLLNEIARMLKIRV